MAGYARVADGVVVELPAVAAGFTLDQCYTADFVSACVPIPDGVVVQVGYLYASGTFSVPPPPPAPTPSATISSYAYLQRFTATETTAIYTAAIGQQPPTPASIQLFQFLHQVAAAGTVTLTDPTVTAGHAALVAAGLLTADRSAAILTP